MMLRSNVKTFDEDSIIIVKDKGCDCEFPICEVYIGWLCYDIIVFHLSPTAELQDYILV